MHCIVLKLTDVENRLKEAFSHFRNRFCKIICRNRKMYVIAYRTRAAARRVGQNRKKVKIMNDSVNKQLAFASSVQHAKCTTDNMSLTSTM